MSKTALITGITGQDGFYLASYLLNKGYVVVGIKRTTSVPNDTRINLLTPHQNLFVVNGDVTDAFSIQRIMAQYKPDEFYHLAAQSVSEDSLCPIKSAKDIRYRTLKDLWEQQIIKNNRVHKENFRGTEVEVIDLPKNTQLKAMGMWNGMGTWFPIKQISRHKWTGKIACMDQKFGSIKVTPNHSILDINQQICKPDSNPWLLNIRKFNTSDKRINSVDKYKDQDLKDLAYFIGAFVSEGHTTYNKLNGGYLVCISNQDKGWLKKLSVIAQKLFDVKTWFVKHKKDGYQDVWRLEFSNKQIYNLMRKWCGVGSIHKKLPDWFMQVNCSVQQSLFDSLIKGDGCYVVQYDSYRYGTASCHLACQFGWLLTSLGYDYTVNKSIPSNSSNPVWSFRTCKSYQISQGQNAKKIELVDYDGWVYDISVDEVNNFTVGVGNIVVHNSHVGKSFHTPKLTESVNCGGTLNCLEAIRSIKPDTKFYFAASSEMFGDQLNVPKPLGCDHMYKGMTLDEDSSMSARSPYGASKIYGYNLTKNYRESYNIHACVGILFNHESPLRGEHFVSRKITLGIADIVHGRSDKIVLGNIDACRDWGFAGDYVRAMHMIINHEEPDEFVVSISQTQSVKDFLSLAFNVAGLGDYRQYIEISKEFYRPSDIEILLGDPSKITNMLGWAPQVSFEKLVELMVYHDIEENKDKKRDLVYDALSLQSKGDEL